MNASRRTVACSAPATPLPDVLIDAHAQIMGWQLATADRGRFAACFPSLRLVVPPATSLNG